MYPVTFSLYCAKVFFLEITDRIHFSDDEAIAINQVLNAVVDNSPQVRHLREKLSSLYDFNVMAKHVCDQRTSRISTFSMRLSLNVLHMPVVIS